MPYQRTLRNPAEFTGKELFGGNEVYVKISPGEPYTGIVYHTKKGKVKSCLENARASKCSILLKQGEVGVLCVEHLNATLFAYEIDNAEVYVERQPSRSFRILDALGLATRLEVVPEPESLQKLVCEKIEQAGIQEQSPYERQALRLERPVRTPRLKIEPIDGDNLVIDVTTDYPAIGPQTKGILVSPQSYREIARARRYAKHIAPEDREECRSRGTIMRAISKTASKIAPLSLTDFLAGFLCYPHFGLSHGFSHDNIFVPPKTMQEWLKAERVSAEIAAHSIIDGLGAISLLPGRLVGARISCKFADHKDYLNILRIYAQQTNL